MQRKEFKSEKKKKNKEQVLFLQNKVFFYRHINVFAKGICSKIILEKKPTQEKNTKQINRLE